MGLDAVEFVLAVEDTFNLAISDEDAVTITTPGKLVQYLETRLPRGAETACHSQRAFYRLRAALERTYHLPRNHLRPTTRWTDILPPKNRARAWRQIQKLVGVVEWPQYKFLGWQLPAARTIGATADYLATCSPAELKAPNEAWSRGEIERIVTALMKQELGITRFQWNDRFVEDLRVD